MKRSNISVRFKSTIGELSILMPINWLSGYHFYNIKRKNLEATTADLKIKIFNQFGTRQWSVHQSFSPIKTLAEVFVRVCVSSASLYFYKWRTDRVKLELCGMINMFDPSKNEVAPIFRKYIGNFICTLCKLCVEFASVWG